MPAALRPPEPLKMTSIMASPRRLLADCSPSTHLKPSTTLLFPQPLGPTIPVIGESKTNSVRSAKLLNPCKISFFKRMGLRSSMTGFCAKRDGPASRGHTAALCGHSDNFARRCNIWGRQIILLAPRLCLPAQATPGATGRGTPRPVLAGTTDAQVCEYADLWRPN